MPYKTVIFDKNNTELDLAVYLGVVNLSIEPYNQNDVPIGSSIVLEYEDVLCLIDWLKELSEKIKPAT